MTTDTRPLVVALEEHYYDPEIAATYPSGTQSRVVERLLDLGEGRIKEMDAAGIDVQVVSHGAPAVQRVNPETAVELAIGANNRLKEAVAAPV